MSSLTQTGASPLHCNHQFQRDLMLLQALFGIEQQALVDEAQIARTVRSMKKPRQFPAGASGIDLSFARRVPVNATTGSEDPLPDDWNKPR